jgi:hypothetical protein
MFKINLLTSWFKHLSSFFSDFIFCGLHVSLKMSVIMMSGTSHRFREYSLIQGWRRPEIESPPADK